MDQTQRENARESLRSIARRVGQRQLAMLTKVESGLRQEAHAARIDRFDMKERPLENEQTSTVQFFGKACQILWRSCKHDSSQRHLHSSFHHLQS